jgi:hypothetical protein
MGLRITLPDSDDQGGYRFSVVYLNKLREAVVDAQATDADNVELDPAKWDSRMLRRTCGRDLLLAGRNLSQVAAVLRDKEDTVREHYARLLATGVFQKSSHTYDSVVPTGLFPLMALLPSDNGRRCAP